MSIDPSPTDVFILVLGSEEDEDEEEEDDGVGLLDRALRFRVNFWGSAGLHAAD